MSSSSRKDGSSDAEIRTGYFVPAGISIVAATFGLARYSYGLFLPSIQDGLNLSIAVMGLIAGGSYLGYLSATLLSIRLSATRGPRLPVIMGGLAATLGMALIAVAPSHWLLAIGVFVAGASPGFAYPPLSDAVVRVITKEKRERVYAWVNSGTGFGVIVAGPIALWAGADWRVAWLSFSALALIATLWSGALMPKGRHGGAEAVLPDFNLTLLSRKTVRPLFIAAFCLGVVTSVYWTFAVDLLTTGKAITEGDAVAFWVFIGVAGIGGSVAGDMVNRLGLRTAYRLMVVACAMSILTLPAAASWMPAALLSGALFGAAFVGATATLGIWSIHIYNDRPSAGFGATFFLFSLGQLVGPIVTGMAAAETGLEILFFASGLLCLALILMTPQRNICSMGG